MGVRMGFVSYNRSMEQKRMWSWEKANRASAALSSHDYRFSDPEYVARLMPPPLPSEGGEPHPGFESKRKKRRSNGCGN